MALTRRNTLAPVLPEPDEHQASPLHGSERIWSESNCYVDLWIELLQALDLEPLAMAAFTLAADFEGRQWSFFKPPLEDLEAVYGIVVGELNVWRPVFEHAEEELAAGRYLTIEVDAWHLPDTAGVSYHLEHTKTSIVPSRIDRSAQTLDYFHGAGYHRLRGEDFDGVTAPSLLPPYTELIRVPRPTRDAAQQAAASIELAARHLRRRPDTNPISRLASYLEEQLPWLRSAGSDAFHRFAFGTCRQCGAEAELAASYLRWLGPLGGFDLDGAADDLEVVAEAAKTLEFALARAARGRSADVRSLLAEPADRWERALSVASAQLGAFS